MKKLFIGILSRISPKRIASFAYKQLTNPQVRKLRENEVHVLDRARQEDFNFGSFNIKLYQWGTGRKKVLLVHGWEGQAGNFADLIEKLLQEDYTIFSFDGPSHGYSSKGETSLFEFTELVSIMIKKFDVKNLVSHSFGGVATTYALFSNQDIQIDKYALLTTPDRFVERIDDIVQAIGITERVKQLLTDRLETEMNVDVTQLNVSDFVQKIHVKSAIIYHDVDDKVIPISRSKNVLSKWETAAFREVEGTGHFRILRDPKVLTDVIGFLDSD